MRHLLRQVFHSPKFLVGFGIFMSMLLLVLIYPLVVKNPPLEIISQGTFLPPGIYVSVYDSIDTTTHYTLKLDDAAAKRIASKLGDEDRLAMQEWLLADGVLESEIDIQDTAKLLEQWGNYYDPAVNIAGMTNAQRNYYIRLDASLDGLLSTEGIIVAESDPDSDDLEEKTVILPTDYVNVNEVPNVRVLPLGTDNFGRDVLSELVKATGVSLVIGLVAGSHPHICASDFDLIQHRAGKARRGHDRDRDRVNLLGVDCQGRTGASHFPAQPRPRQSVEVVWALNLSHHSQRYSAVHRLLCRHGADLADFRGDPGGGQFVDPWVRTKDDESAHPGVDDELGDDLPGSDLGEMVGLLPCDRGHCVDCILDESDEHGSRSGIQSSTAGLGNKNAKGNVRG
jgi:ABC-type dipeptide/oligopeptide/nickel transport system permease subunit